MMTATEMSIMAIFMVMFMMDPGGLGEMDMKHQRKLSLGAGIVAFGGALLVAIFANWGPLPASIPDGGAQLRLLGVELLGRSMLIFESAGLTILTAMIAATAVAVQPARRPEPAMAGGTGGHDHGAGGHAAGGHGGAMASTGQDRHAAHDAHHDHAAHGGEHGQGHGQAGHGTGKYTCPMHPEVVSDKPGSCPKCGMNLVPVDGAEHASHDHEHHHGAAAQYTCPMHPEVVSDEPGSCPKCGMNLVPVGDGDHGGHGGHSHEGHKP